MYVDMNRRSCSTRRLHDLYITMCVHLVGAMVLQRHTCSNHLFPWMIDTGCSAVNQLSHHNVHLPTTACGKQGDRTSPYWHMSQTHTHLLRTSFTWLGWIIDYHGQLRSAKVCYFWKADRILSTDCCHGCSSNDKLQVFIDTDVLNIYIL